MKELELNISPDSTQVYTSPADTEPTEEINFGDYFSLLSNNFGELPLRNRRVEGGEFTHFSLADQLKAGKYIGHYSFSRVWTDLGGATAEQQVNYYIRPDMTILRDAFGGGLDSRSDPFVGVLRPLTDAAIQLVTDGRGGVRPVLYFRVDKSF